LRTDWIFSALSTILSRSSRVKAFIVFCRTTVVMQVTEISVLGVLLSLVGFVNQNVETSGIGVAVHYGVKLLFVQGNDCLHRFAESLE
jgi:hypothetical protein